MEFHKLADLFPLLEGPEYDALVADIKLNGQIYPIWTYEDKIIDGRNRWRACQDLGIDPYFEDYTGNNPRRFVISQNILRRHLTEFQRAAWVVENTLEEYEEQQAQKESDRKQGLSDASESPQGNAVDLAGEEVGVSGDLVGFAKKVKKLASELIPLAIAGKLAGRTALDLAVQPVKVRGPIARDLKRGKIKNIDVRKQIKELRLEFGLDQPKEA